MKLNTKIVLFVLEISLIPLMFIGFIVYSNNKTQIIQSTLIEVDTVAQVQKNRLEAILHQKQTLIHLFIEKPLFRSYMQSPAGKQKFINDTLLEEKADSDDSIKDILIVNSLGRIAASTNPSLLAKNVSDEDYFIQGMKQVDISLLKKDNTGATVHYLVGPLIVNGKTLGMVAIITDAGDITNLANDYTGLGNTGETLLVKNDGHDNALFLTPIRFDKNAALVRTVTKENRNIPSIRAISQEEGAYTNLVDYRNKPVFAATRYIQSNGWGIVVKIDQTEALSPVYKLRMLFFLLFGGSAAIIILLSLPVVHAVVVKEEELVRAKDEFISLATHQLKTPLTAISWNIELLFGKDYGALNKKQKEIVKNIQDSIRTMNDLVSGFLDMTKAEAAGYTIEKGDVDLAHVSDAVLTELAGQISNKKLKIIKKYEPGVPHLDIGTKTATIIFQNLLTNAVKYTPEKGTVDVRIEKNPQGVLVSVQDTGYGIPEDAKKRIFTKLFRAQNIREKEPSGTGLGLYLVKLLVEKLNGKIWFESKEGVGTTFFVLLH